MDIQQCNRVYVSLGPACFTASVLKYAKFRRFSLPFDWARSGSGQWEDSFELSPEEFYIKNIATPNHRMVQVGDPEMDQDKMSELRYEIPKYGYPYFFNPHIKIGHDKRYMLRCLERLKLIYAAKDTLIIFVLSKHKNKPEEEGYFMIGKQLIEYFEQRLSLSGINAAMHLIEVGSSQAFTPSISVREIGRRVSLFDVDVHKDLYYGSDDIRQQITGLLYRGVQGDTPLLELGK